MHTLPPQLNDVLTRLRQFCATHHVAAWLVGGATRDLTLGRVPYDFDLAVDADGVALARTLANASDAAFVPLDEERGTGRVVFNAHGEGEALVVDLVQLRGPSLEADLRLRDFTINALALPLELVGAASWQQQLIDPCGGVADLNQRQLRPCGPTSLSDDPLRVLRAVRQAAALGFSITRELDGAMRAAVPGLHHVAAERVRDELMKLLSLPAGGAWLRYLDEIGALTLLIPELEAARMCDQPHVHFLPVLAHMLETVVAVEWLLYQLERPEPCDGDELLQPTNQSPVAYRQSSLPVAVQTHPSLCLELAYAAQLQQHFVAPVGGHNRAALLKFAALLHDVAKPQTKQHLPDGRVSFYGHQDIGAEIAGQVARRFRLSRSDAAYVALVVREHMRPGQLRTAETLTKRAVVRFFRDTGDAGPDVLLHELADHLATSGPNLSVEGWQAHQDWTGTLLAGLYAPPEIHPVALLNGNEVMAALNLPPGPLVGTVLQELQEAQACGEIFTRDEALALARAVVAKQQRAL
jgi:poly(A) polymerase/tRNA nucleotidyltransferase (CCA-adding enzyme)